MAGVTRLLLALQEISLPGDLPGECDLGLALKHFFERTDIQTLMVQMNQTQLYNMMESRTGSRLGTYADKTGSTAARPGTSEPQTVRKPYSGGIENPYGRYTSSTADEDPSYTASFKPDGAKERPARVRNNGTDKNPSGKPDTTDKPRT